MITKNILKQGQNGFTLIEILVVIFIMGIFFSLVVINLRRGLAVNEINNQALVFLDYLDRAQSLSLAGSKIEELSPLSYGIIAANQIDFTNHSDYDGCTSGCLFVGTINGLVYVEDIKWPDNLLLDRGLINEWRVNFELPRAKTTIFFDGSPVNQAVFKLKDEKSNLSKCIEINSISGRFEIINCP